MADLEILPKRIDTLDSSDRNCTFRINIDVLNECFGANRSIYMHACYPQGKHRFIPGTKQGEKFVVWMPKLYGNSSEWKNSISADNNTIYEIAEDSRHSDWMDADKHDLDVMRLVFVKPGPNLPYVFKGVFVNGKMDFLNHSYRRIATKVKLIGDPVTRVELLDHIDREKSDSKLESLCSRLDTSISLDEALKKKAEEFASFVHDRDKSDGKLDFTDPNSFLFEEEYKHELFKRSQQILNISSWDESWINSGKIFAKILPVILDNDNNLINNFNNKTNFNDHFRKGNQKYDSRSERAVFDVYKSSNERQAFEQAINVFGAKFPTIAYLFFLKDETRFLPISPENFERSFRELNIKIILRNKCGWDVYNRFIQIIDCIREQMPLYMELDHEPTLLEAHSFVWIIGRPEFSNWLKGHEYQKVKVKEKQRKKQEEEERQLRIAREHSLTLADFSLAELRRIAPRLNNIVINNSLKGAATIVGFNIDSLSMDIIYKNDEEDGDAQPTTVFLTDTSKKNFYFSQDTVDYILTGENKEPATNPVSEPAADPIIPEDEDEQFEQAAILPTEQLYVIAEKHKSLNPERREVTTKQYRRDPYIAELAKRESNGICRLCGMEAPFVTSEGKPYLETHHIKWLSEGGTDTIENTVAVCPNCHRKLHILNAPEDVEFLKSLRSGQTSTEKQ